MQSLRVCNFIIVYSIEMKFFTWASSVLVMVILAEFASGQAPNHYLPVANAKDGYPNVWSLQQKNMCLKGSKRGAGTFKIQRDGDLSAIKLTFNPKFVSCACKKLKIGKCDASNLRVIITNKRKSVHFPGFLGKKFSYKNKAYSEGANSLVLDDPSRYNIVVKKGQVMRAFMGNLAATLKGCGVPCVDVYASIRGKVKSKKVKPPCAKPGKNPVQPVKPPTSPTKPPKLRCDGHDNGCCTEKTPCNIGEGDCDSNRDCKGNLICGHNNCPWGDNDDCCMAPLRPNMRCDGHDNGCCTRDKPCHIGEGDCDSDSECLGKLVCGHNNCPWGDNDDCCVKPKGMSFNAFLRCHGHDNGCCTEKTPCNIGEGDCDSNRDCKGNLICGHNNCPWGDNDDCCMAPLRPNMRCDGHDNGCCTEDKPCLIGEGDCDSDSECKGDLVCGHNNCPWGDNDDCCIKPK